MQDVYANSFFTVTVGFCNSCLWNTFLRISILVAIGLVVMSTCYPLVLFNQLIYDFIVSSFACNCMPYSGCTSRGPNLSLKN